MIGIRIEGEAMATLAVVILTKNEEKNIEACIKSASFADDILVVDSGSEDRTEIIAKAAGARFILHPMGEDGFAGQRNFALQHISADWVFYLDADERITPEAAASIQSIVAENPGCAYRVKRMNIVFGKMMYYGGHRPDYSDRLFPRDAVHWEGYVHEVAVCSLPQKIVDGTLHHYTYTTWSQYMEKLNKYTSMAAESSFKRGKKIGAAGIFAHSWFAFFKLYILKQGFRDGYYGLVMSVMAGIYDLVKYLKLYNMCANNQKVGD